MGTGRICHLAEPEIQPLGRTNKKFIRRFSFLETSSKEDGKELSDMTLAEMDVYWEQAKGREE